MLTPSGLRPSTGATRSRYSTDWILELRVDRCGAQLYDYRKVMIGRSAEHSHAMAVPIRKRIQPPHGPQSPTLGPQSGRQFRSARPLAPALGGVRLRVTVPPRRQAPTRRRRIALTYRWGRHRTRSMLRSCALRSSTMRAAKPFWKKCTETCPKTVWTVVMRSR